MRFKKTATKTAHEQGKIMLRLENELKLKEDYPPAT